jgi:hypothetical protein
MPGRSDQVELVDLTSGFHGFKLLGTQTSNTNYKPISNQLKPIKNI